MALFVLQQNLFINMKVNESVFFSFSWQEKFLLKNVINIILLKLLCINKMQEKSLLIYKCKINANNIQLDKCTKPVLLSEMTFSINHHVSWRMYIHHNERLIICCE